MTAYLVILYSQRQSYLRGLNERTQELHKHVKNLFGKKETAKLGMLLIKCSVLRFLEYWKRKKKNFFSLLSVTRFSPFERVLIRHVQRSWVQAVQ